MASETVEQLKKQLDAVKKDRDMAFELEQRSKQLEKQIKELEKGGISREKYDSLIEELNNETEKKNEALSFATKAYEKCKEKIILNCLLKKKLQKANDKKEDAIKELREYSEARRNQQYEKKIDELYEIINKQYSYCEQLHTQIDEQYETIKQMHQYAKEQYKIIEKQCDYSDELIVKITKQNNNIKNETIEKNIYDMVIKNTVYKEYCAYKIQCEELKKQIENTSKKCSLCNTLKKQIEDTQKKNKNLEINYNAICREFEDTQKKNKDLEINYNAICREFEILKHMQPVNSQMRPPIQQLMNPQSMQQLMNPPVQQPKNKLNLNAVAFNPSFI
jgi:hypothetical protein